MNKVISDERIPIKLWLDDIEEGALAQTRNLANLPFAFKHIAIMPDSHQGYGMPIGGVLATKGGIIPNAVGVDIGCGMCALKVDINEITTEDLIKIRNLIKKRIPTGMGKWHKEKQNHSIMPPLVDTTGIAMVQWDRALYQIGTLGSGNHFIEIQKGSDGYIWIMIHSGSRNIGYKVAQHYNKLAVDLNEKWYSSVPKKQELAYLPIHSDEAKKYMTEMQYCVEFAFASRKLMMNRVQESFFDTLGSLTFDSMINIAHNYAAWENHFGSNVIVHRKGATRAYEGEFGIIPGSQGTSSYIVEGLGNEQSFKSCSHGAGRNMGRTAARKHLDLIDERVKMQGIIHDMESDKQLDEAPGAYKDIDVVMNNQKDLVKILVELKPLAVVKG